MKDVRNYLFIVHEASATERAIAMNELWGSAVDISTNAKPLAICFTVESRRSLALSNIHCETLSLLERRHPSVS